MPQITLLTVSGSVVASRLLFGSYQVTGEVLFAGCIGACVVISEIGSSGQTRTPERLSDTVSNWPWGTVAVTACCLLGVGVGGAVIPGLFVETSPLVAGMDDPTPGVAFLTGDTRAHDAAQAPFLWSAVGTVLVAVVVDAVRRRAVRWLTAVTLVVGGSGLSLRWYPSRWTATVAAVGGSLTVIVVALVLDGRADTESCDSS